MKRQLITIFILSILCNAGWSQNIPPLERVISVSFQDETIDNALNIISREGKFVFSYSPAIFNSNLRKSGDFEDKSVREILNNLFGETIETKGKGNYIILTKAAALPKRIEVTAVSISGYVIDGETAEKIAEASVYDKETLTASISDQFGYFKIMVEDPGRDVVLHFSKRGYLDTVIMLNPGTTQFLNMQMKPEPPVVIVDVKVTEPVDTAIVQTEAPSEWVPLPEVERSRKSIGDFFRTEILSKNLFSKKKGGVNMANIRDTLYRDFQVSFVPFVGSNHKLSGNVINKYSLNVLGGYSMGTAKLEVGGLFNIDRSDMSYVQAAGLVNIVGGKTKGTQFAGLANITSKDVEAFQFAGLFNSNLGAARSGQFAGLFNVNGKASQGVQMAGLLNIQPKDYKGVQAAGLLNLATQRIDGVQAAGLVNYAHNIHGTQIGLLNVADSIQGIPIGLVSFVSHGYHKLELSADEIFYVNAAFRTGVRHFYNILTAGLKPETLDGSQSPSTVAPGQGNIWSFGYGIGTAPKVTKWLYLNFDLTSNKINQGSFTESVNLLNKLYLGFDFQITKGFSITAGATLNGYIYDPTYADNPTLFTDFTPNIVKEYELSNGYNMQLWWGGKVGLRFF